jgi:DNA-directed RNA polymerase subunit RPC12/RpoP
MNAILPKQPQGSASEIEDSDIIFDCPQCAKSLAIDSRGAGLMIACPDCGTRIQVPYPEPGKGPSNLEKVTSLRQSMDQLRMMTSEHQAMRDRLNAEIAVIQSAIDRMVDILQEDPSHGS